jgi:hypothetical protein
LGRDSGKERFETSSPGAYAVLDDFCSATVWDPRRRRLGGRRQDKGFAGQYALLIDILRGRREPPSVDGFLISSLATLAAARSLETGRAQPVVMAPENSTAKPSEAELAR